ncbi:MAG: hypothetical protein UHS49_00160 [Faecalimonas sp.]|nr:hypothetical protein [Faecalimonas sp.]
MKKMKRIVIAVGILAVMCVGLSGCRQIDNMRKKQAIVTSGEMIVIDGKEYLKLPECEFLTPEFSYFADSYGDSDSTIYMTDEEVPVLLSSIIGERGDISLDGIFIDGYDGTYYCREDKYEEMLDIIEKGYQPDALTCSYFDSEQQKFVNYVFSEEEMKQIVDILAGPAEQLVDEEVWAATDVQSCMTGYPFSEHAFDILQIEEGYFFELYNADIEAYLHYKVPAELAPVIGQCLQ